MSNYQEIDSFNKQIEKVISNTKDLNQKSKIKREAKSKISIEMLSKESGLQQNPEFLENLISILKYGFQDQLEIQMDLSGFYFSANLKRDSLRENESLIIRKYSRQTEIDFILFGIVTQYQRSNLGNVNEKTELKSMKEAIMKLVSSLSNVESSFTGRLSNEIIIDPIALYTEL